MAYDEIERRAAAADVAASSSRLAGYAAIFNSPAVIAGEFTEKIAPGAFAASLRRNDVVALMAHDPGRVLGRTSSATLKLAEDNRGLAFTLDVDPSTPDGAAAIGLVKRQDIKGCSFGFMVRAESWIETSGLPLRTLEEIDVFEITLTAFPAYENTTVAIRSLNAWRSNAAMAARLRIDLDIRQRALRLRRP